MRKNLFNSKQRKNIFPIFLGFTNFNIYYNPIIGISESKIVYKYTIVYGSFYFCFNFNKEIILRNL